ncbi:MAG: flagellar basal-body rod protein FlgF, partial [Acidithiobacillus sp.]|nr:flagellar basal-body rod protein FlgF [Acidithiobacillus sp.]
LASERNLDVVANNLANTNTTGYKAERAAFRAVPFFYEGLPNRVDVVAQKNGINLQQGPIQKTGRPLDIALSGPGFFVVQSQGGEKAYTRAGNLDISAQQMLVNANGQAILGTNGAPIYVPANANIRIAQDGTVSAIPNTPNAQAVTVGKVLVVNPSANSIQLAGANLFSPANNGQIDLQPIATPIVPGALEGSNVNPVGTMVHMISASRLFQWETEAEQTLSTDQQDTSTIPSNL